MNSFTLDRRLAAATAIRNAWTRNEQTWMRVAIALLAICAALKLGDEVRRMIWDFEHGSSWDLKYAYRQVSVWFSGNSFYAELQALYPPASYVLFYPFVGWLPIEQVRWLWMAATAATLAWLVYLLVKYSGAETRAERILIACFLLAMNSTGVAFGIGQWILFLLPFLLVGLFTLQQPVSWRRDLVAAACLTLTLIKPNISVPFFWLVLFASGGWRVLGLVALAYSGLSFLAASFQSTPLLDLIGEWTVQASTAAATQGYGNISIWLASLGLGRWALFGSLLVLIATGVWTWRHRELDLWLQLGVIAIAARLWTYHQIADDPLIMLPIIALFRIASRGAAEQGDDVIAGLLLAATMLLMLLPAQMYYSTPPLNLLFTIAHSLIWIIDLIFLVIHAERKIKGSLSPSPYQSQPSFIA